MYNNYFSLQKVDFEYTIVLLFCLLFLAVQTQTAASSLLHWLQHSGLMVSVWQTRKDTKSATRKIPAAAVVLADPEWRPYEPLALNTWPCCF